MNRVLGRVYFGLMAAMLLAPLVVVTGVSLNERRRLLFPPEGFSLQWYGALFRDNAWLNAVTNSLSIAALAALAACSIALPVAYALWRYRLFYVRVLFGLGIAPFILPPVITALGYLIFWTQTGQYGQFWAVVISHGIFLVTLPLITISLGFETIDSAYTEAAATMGADERTVFRTVILPMVLPYIVSGYAFAFVISLNEYIIAYMVAGFTVETLPIKVFNALRYGYTPVMAAVSVVFIGVSFAIFGLVAKFGDLPKLLGAWSPREE